MIRAATARTCAGTCAGKNGAVTPLCGVCGVPAAPVYAPACVRVRAHACALGPHAAQPAHAAQARRGAGFRVSVGAHVPAPPGLTPHSRDRARAPDLSVSTFEKKMEEVACNG